MVYADFSEITSKQRQKTYARLQKASWIKVTESEKNICTVWYASFIADVSEETAKIIAWTEFEECSVPFCTPKLAIHWGTN